jgi:UDP-N-acetylmuramate dehydrogenase
MMPARTPSPQLIDRLPPLRGRISSRVSLAAVTWFRVGGPAEVMVRPADVEDLAVFLNGRPRDVALTVLGVGSNVLIRDGGIDGIVLRLGRGFAGVSVEGNRVRAGAAALDVNVALAARDAGLAGLEFLRGIPGTIGGALKMNAGAYGGEIRDVLVEATALDAEGGRHVLSAADMGFTYRHSCVPDDWILVEGVFEGRPGDPVEIGARMAAIAQAREDSQPIRTRTGGSTFKNPPDRRAWELIDAAGCRGLTRGGAQVSEQHCNFLINLGEATAADLESLGEEVRWRVLENSGVELQWEVVRLGRPAPVAYRVPTDEKP